MVRLGGIAAKNAPVTKVDDGAGVTRTDVAAQPGDAPEETPEAQEAGLVSLYQSALRSAAEGDAWRAVQQLQSVLDHPLLAIGPDGHMRAEAHAAAAQADPAEAEAAALGWGVATAAAHGAGTREDAPLDLQLLLPTVPGAERLAGEHDSGTRAAEGAHQYDLVALLDTRLDVHGGIAPQPPSPTRHHSAAPIDNDAATSGVMPSPPAKPPLPAIPEEGMEPKAADRGPQEQAAATDVLQARVDGQDVLARLTRAADADGHGDMHGGAQTDTPSQTQAEAQATQPGRGATASPQDNAAAGEGSAAHQPKRVASAAAPAAIDRAIAAALTARMRAAGTAGAAGVAGTTGGSHAAAASTSAAEEAAAVASAWRQLWHQLHTSVGSADGLPVLTSEEHAARAEELLQRLQAAAVLLELEGRAAALGGHPHQTGELLEAPAIRHLYERDDQVLEAQESYLQVLQLLPTAAAPEPPGAGAGVCEGMHVDAGEDAGSSGSGPSRGRAQQPGVSATNVREALPTGSEAPGLCAELLPGCLQLRMPTEASVRAKLLQRCNLALLVYDLRCAVEAAAATLAASHSVASVSSAAAELRKPVAGLRDCLKALTGCVSSLSANSGTAAGTAEPPGSVVVADAPLDAAASPADVHASEAQAAAAAAAAKRLPTSCLPRAQTAKALRALVVEVGLGVLACHRVLEAAAPAGPEACYSLVTGLATMLCCSRPGLAAGGAPQQQQQLADLDSLPPLDAAVAVLMALEGCAGHGSDGGREADAMEVDAAGPQEGPEQRQHRAERRLELLRQLWGAQAQLLWLLYGVHCPWRTARWGFGLLTAAAEAEAEVAARDGGVHARAPNRQDVMLLWRLVGAHAVLLSQPPPELLRLLPPGQQKELHASFTDLLQALLPALELLRTELPPPAREIHRCLYFCILRANELDTPEGTDALFKDARSRKLKLLPPAAPVLAAAAAGAAHSSLGCSSSEGLQWLERQAAPVLWDVALNPLRLGSWAALKLLYTRAARAMLQEAAEGIAAPSYAAHQQQPGSQGAAAQYHLARMCRLAVRAGLAAARLDPDAASRAGHYGGVASLVCELIAPLSPLYDNLQLLPPMPITAAATAAGTSAAAAGIGGGRRDSLALAEPYLQGSECAGGGGGGSSTCHRGSSAGSQLRRDWRFRAACRVAGDMFGRAASVLGGNWELEYYQSTAGAEGGGDADGDGCDDLHVPLPALLAAVGAQPGKPAAQEELEALLLEDARQALTFAAAAYYKPAKDAHHYHPARYVLARCELLLGDTAAAEAALRPLFAPTKSGRGRSAAASAFTLDDTVGEPANEEPAAAQRPPRFLWATHPEYVAGHGPEEEAREHITATRKCLALYLQVCWERNELGPI
eukprot:XP_001697942.1 predicted protein [Chlamydomonas reinhardtii]